ncbi:MAG: MgtC/SapB family protein [Leptospiraceae bacterium]|nr:MgtC/SapB family protein [Leptospiraceae bacterium]
MTSAFILGGIIGVERQYRQRTAGFRTNVLVAVGASLFVDIANRTFGPEGTVRVISYVVSGIGFLGAGVIMRGEGNVRGLNTAATLWGSAAVGASTGADLLVEAVLGTFFILSANTFLRPIVNFINRKPVDLQETEMNIYISVIVEQLEQEEFKQKLELLLKENHLPILNLEIQPFGNEFAEISVTLILTFIDTKSLDEIIAQIKKYPEVKHAYWTSSNLDN